MLPDIDLEDDGDTLVGDGFTLKRVAVVLMVTVVMLRVSPFR